MLYYLQQCFAKWDRGLELLRSVSKRQGSTAADYETMRFIHANYSIISRMEAVHVRDASLLCTTTVHKFRMKYDSTLSCMESLEDGMSWWIVVSFTNSSCGWLMLHL